MRNDFLLNWQTAKLADVLTVKGGKRLPKGVGFSKEYTGFPYIRIVDLLDRSVRTTGLKYLDAETKGRLGQYTIGKDDIYLSIAGTIGIAGTLPEELDGANLTENAARLIIKDKDCIFKDFVALFLTSEDGQAQIRNLTTKTTQPKLALTRIEQIQIPVPPLQQQRAISRALGAVQEAKAAQQREIALERERKAALMEYLFTHGACNEPTKQTEIGEMPEGWQVRQLGDLCSITTGTTPATKNKSYYQGSIPFIRTAEIKNQRIKDATTYISEQAVIDYNLKLYPPKTVFLAMYGQGKTRGQAGILDISAATTQNTAAFIINAELDPEYLWHWLISQYKKLRGAGAQGHISHLNLGYVKSYKIPIPPLAEQAAIISVLRACDRKINASEGEVELLNELFIVMLEELMTGKVSAQPLVEVTS